MKETSDRSAKPGEQAAHSATAAAIIVAAGSGSRAGADLPKQYRRLGGKAVLAWSVGTFVRHPAITRVHVVVAPGAEVLAAHALGDLARHPKVTLGAGGATRQQSVHLGLEQVAGAPPEYVLIHDAARPLVERETIDRVLATLEDNAGAAPALPVADSLRRKGADGLMGDDVDRQGVYRMQTPQGFRFGQILAAHRAARTPATDDAALFRAAGHPVRLVAGTLRGRKLTTPDDFREMEAMLTRITLTGQGFDIHRFAPDVASGAGGIWLCGVHVPFPRTLLGHSDADVGLHALVDALLGTIGAGDIGQHFPPSDPQWKEAASAQFLTYAAQKVTEAGGRILHCDVTILADEPRIGPYRQDMLAKLAAILENHAPRLSIKATTMEGLGPVGRKEGIAALAIATVSLPDQDEASDV